MIFPMTSFLSVSKDEGITYQFDFNKSLYFQLWEVTAIKPGQQL